MREGTGLGFWIKEKQYDMKSKSIILGADAYYATHPASLPSSCSLEEALGRAGDKASFEMMMMAMMIAVSEGSIDYMGYQPKATLMTARTSGRWICRREERGTGRGEEEDQGCT